MTGPFAVVESGVVESGTWPRLGVRTSELLS